MIPRSDFSRPPKGLPGPKESSRVGKKGDIFCDDSIISGGRSK